ncbi:alpha/beta fold hydrolase [Sphingomonas gilva]|uniref:Alpha/beta fold hydrolase n=1 Tax=Sphingomonas gilva TaxID=2305907 RepID=A0A396S179_9SPHN|nr:alpha/beta fold hydrolase [Sphingomonas gilva]RHW17125.1 alpha/beta fold hydrolase [Sphingomonas gilva]
MASSPIESHRFAAPDGVSLAWHQTGEGRPVVLLHGYFSDADTNWIRYGHAAAIAARGFRVIMPDLRAHGESGKPHNPNAYPPDVLADDGLALIAHLGLIDYDLGGYSLGGRTVVRMLVKGATPGKVIVSGMGLEGLTDTGKRGAHFRNVLSNLGSFEKGTPEWFAEAFLKTTGGDPVALLGILDSFVDTTEAEIAAINQPALILAGDADDDNGSHEALAALMPSAKHVEVPGNHMNVVTKAPFGEAIADFLAG